MQFARWRPFRKRADAESIRREVNSIIISIRLVFSLPIADVVEATTVRRTVHQTAGHCRANAFVRIRCPVWSWFRQNHAACLIVQQHGHVDVLTDGTFRTHSGTVPASCKHGKIIFHFGGNHGATETPLIHRRYFVLFDSSSSWRNATVCGAQLVRCSN